jgi:PEP-CTERM motif
MKPHSFIRLVLGFIAISSVATASRVGASVIDFSDQPAGPEVFPPSASAQTLVYNVEGVSITFTGGLILTAEHGIPVPIDQGNVYATAPIANSDLTNPLTITFSKPVQNLVVTVVNGLEGDYFLSDNAGHSNGFSLPTGSTSEGTGELADPGTVVQVGFFGPGVGDVAFDFALGQISFDVPAPSTVPEPSSVMLGAGLFALAVAHFRRRFSK